MSSRGRTATWLDLPSRSEPQRPTEEDLDEADSLVLAYSLVQTRQRHLTKLFPLVFTHPPLPSWARPRAPRPTAGTFIYPSPAPPPLPLPSREYHGPRIDADKGKGKDKDKDKDKDAKTKPSKRAERAAKMDEQTPAHEIECIARVTLSIGPISFADTEVWVGRFVDPASHVVQKEKKDKPPPVPRVRKPYTYTPRPPRPPVPRADAARPPPHGAPVPRPPGQMLPRPLPQRPPPGPGSTFYAVGSSYRPQPIRPQLAQPRPIAGPSRPPPRPPAPAAAVDLNVVARINEVATRFPQLHVIIHRSAKGNATKEEFSILGRIVAKVSRGEEITEADTRPPVPAQRPALPLPPVRPASSSSTVRPPPVVRPPPPTEVKPKPSPADDDDSELSELDSDSEVDMKGSPQVGGGPLPPEALPGSIEDSRLDANIAANQVRLDAPAPANLSQTNIPSKDAPPTIASPTAFPAANAHPSDPAPRYAPLAFAYKTNASDPARAPIVAGPTAPASTPPAAATLSAPGAGTQNPVVPPPVSWPPVPRFLVVSFKETYTDKMLVPLGMNSYVSRVGGDYVTGPAPVDPATGKTRSAKVEKPTKAAPVGRLGTVLVSMFVPAEWREMEWDGIETQLPWVAKGKGPLPNLGAIDLCPEGPLHALTVKLEGMDDAAWKVFKSVIDEVEAAEASKMDDPSAYAVRKKAEFSARVARVPPREYLQTRTPTVDPAIVEAMTDKWALRPYPISTTALYDATGDGAGPEPFPEPAQPPAKKRKADEPAVTFEMPVSLDALDELVEEGARAKDQPRKSKGPKKASRGRKDVQCEGCGQVGRKVWRNGPNGSKTLCNACGDSFLQGELGELKAPGLSVKVEQSEEPAATGEANEEVSRDESRDATVATGVDAVEADAVLVVHAEEQAVEAAEVGVPPLEEGVAAPST